MIEVKRGDEIHQYGSYLVKGFEFLVTGAYYLSVSAFAPSVRLGWSGFVKLLVDGDVQLMTKYEIEFKKAYYIPALDAGDKRDELLLKSENYMYRDSELIIIPKSEKNSSNFLTKTQQMN